MHSCIDIHPHTHTHYIAAFSWQYEVPLCFGLKAFVVQAARCRLKFAEFRRQLESAQQCTFDVWLAMFWLQKFQEMYDMRYGILPAHPILGLASELQDALYKALDNASPKPPFGSVQTRKLCAIAGWSEEILSCNILWMLSRLCEVSCICRCEGFYRAGQLLSETKSLNNLLGHSSLGLRVGTLNQLQLLQISSNTLFWLESKLLILRGQVIHFECP